MAFIFAEEKEREKASESRSSMGLPTPAQNFSLP